MFNDDNFGPRTLIDPGRLQQDVITELFDRLDGQITISDPNNGFNYLLEANAAITSAQVRLMENNFEKLYPSRVTTSDGLFRHMSDFDYLGLTASPAQLDVRVIFDVDFLIANAISFNEDYNLVRIPDTARFRIGNRVYSLYYPINIRINKRTDTVIVTHDLSKKNPLKTFESNIVETERARQNGLNVIMLTIPTYQYDQMLIEETMIPGRGFRNTYTYTDQLYAARVFTFIDNAWKELRYTLSEDIYDRTQATARIKMFSERQELEVSIPYIYFTKGLIGDSIRVFILTSQGQLNTIITESEAETSNVLIDFDTAPKYTQILANIPTIQAFPLDVRVTGGRDGLTFDEVRQRVITNSLQTNVPITQVDLQNYLEDRGYDFTKSVDNVTDRIYFAHQRLRGGANNDIPILVSRIKLDLENIGDVSTIRRFSDDVTTILPNTIFEYDKRTNICKPLPDDKVRTLQTATSDELARLLNENTFLRTPVHISVYTSGQYPEARSFNLIPTESPVLLFDRENVNSSTQMSVEASAIRHRDDGTNGYRLRLGVRKSNDLRNVSEDDLYVLIIGTDRSGQVVYKRAERNPNFDTETLNMYDIIFDTDYHITEDGYFRTQMNLSEDKTILSEFTLRQKFSIHFLTTRDVVPSNIKNDPKILEDIPGSFNSLFGLLKQFITVTFGRSLKNIFHPTDAVWKQKEFKRHAVSVPYTYQKDQYKTNEDGSLVYEIDDEGNIQLEKIASKGDVMYDACECPIMQYEKGDIIRNIDGDPILKEDRSLEYFVDAMMVDARMYASEDPKDITYIDTLPSLIQDYDEDMIDIQKTLIEETKIYFTPIRTLGRTTFGLGGGRSKTTSLELSFSITYYVSSFTLSDKNLQEVIRERTIDIVRQEVGRETISVTNIAKTLLEIFKDYAISVDVGGINDTLSEQTFFVQNKDVAPMVRLILQQLEDGSLVLVPDIDVFFILDARTLPSA